MPPKRVTFPHCSGDFIFVRNPDLAVVSRRPGPLLFPRGWTLRLQGALEVDSRVFPPAHNAYVHNAYVLQDRAYRVPMGHPGLIIVGGSSDPLIGAARRVPVFATLLPPTADHPLLGRVATYRVEYTGPPSCPPSSPCNPPSPWRLLDGGS